MAVAAWRRRVTGRPRTVRRAVAVATSQAWAGDKPPQSTLPLTPDGEVDYSSIDRSPVSVVMSGTVRRLLSEEAGHDSPVPGFTGIVELSREVNDMQGTAE